MDELQLFLKIGEKIRQIRISKNISQQSLADMLNFEKSNMSRIEAGRTNLTVKNLFRISRALGVRMKDLIDFDEEEL